MRRTQILILLIALLTAAAVLAGEQIEQRKIKIVTDGGQTLHLDISDLEIGETHYETTADGSPIEITRTEEGFDLDVNGETLAIGDLLHIGGRGHGVAIDLDADNDGDGTKRRMVMVNVDGDSTVIDGDHDMVWIGDGGDDERIIHIEQPNTYEHLLESGALDDLSSDQQERIREALEAVASPHIEKHVIRVHADRDDN